MLQMYRSFNQPMPIKEENRIGSDCNLDAGMQGSNFELGRSFADEGYRMNTGRNADYQ